MSDEGDNNFKRYLYRGEDGEVIPRYATHITVREDVRVVRTIAFCQHPNIIEVICHDKVEKIDQEAFWFCPRLRRVIMPGVKIVEWRAFCECEALTDVKCGKLEIIREAAFRGCKSLRSINLPSAEIVEGLAFKFCDALTQASFGNKLESFGVKAFNDCRSMERISIPLTDDMITDESIFQGCDNLKHVDLVEGSRHETIAALHLEDWRNDMNEEIDRINRILPTAPGGGYDAARNFWDEGGKARTIRVWIRSVLRKIVHYREEHQRILIEAASTLKFALPTDIVTNNVLSFVELPSYTLEVEDHKGEEEDDNEWRDGQTWRRFCFCWLKCHVRLDRLGQTYAQAQALPYIDESLHHF